MWPRSAKDLVRLLNAMFFLCCTFSAVICRYEGDKVAFVEDIRQALYASKIVSYAQGFMLLREVFLT